MGSLTKTFGMRGTFKILVLMVLAIQVAKMCIPVVEKPANSASTTTTTSTSTTSSSTTSPTLEKTCVTVELNPGRTCVFPFIYRYKEHYECLPFKGKYWCSLTPVYD